jgi:hypothetical protein
MLESAIQRCSAFAYIANISSKDCVEKESLFMTTVGAYHKGASCDLEM